MRKFKRVVAVALAATMVMGSSFATFAAGETSGETVGTGASEGHVDMKKTHVELPTIAEGAASPFTYTMDPEGLVSGTNHEKYENAEFPAKESDTGVYFNKGKKGGDGSDKDNIVYGNESIALDAINKSSHAINLTVKAEAVSADTDIPLVVKDALTTATDASLYLGLVVDSEAAVAVTKDAAATKTVAINGTDANFKIAAKADKTGYEYREITLAEYQALDGNSGKTQDDLDASWARASFKIEGSTTTNKAITEATTAPSVKVTWSWVDPSANTAPNIAIKSYTMTSDAAIDIVVDLGNGNLSATTVSKVMDPTGAFDYMSAGYATYDETNKKLTLTASMINALISGNVPSVDVIFDDDNETSVTITLTK